MLWDLINWCWEVPKVSFSRDADGGLQSSVERDHFSVRRADDLQKAENENESLFAQASVYKHHTCSEKLDRCSEWQSGNMSSRDRYH